MDSAPDDSSSFYTPTVDIGPYLTDPTSPAALSVISDIRAACQSTGFFQLLGHGVSASLQASVFEAAAKLFALPSDVKMAMKATKDTGHKGYTAMASQSYQTNVLPDLKEGFIAGADHKPDDPLVLAKRFIASPNVWPPEEQLPRSDFREPLEAYYEAMLSLAGVVLDLVAATLPYGPHVFDGFTDNNPACPLRLLHYPPTKMPVAGELPQLGSSAHTDFGAITLLLQDEHEGLEVLDQATGEWHLLPPRKDAYVVNLGDMMSKMTAGHYKSSMHRVINRNKTDRYSVVFFFDGNRDFKLKPLGTTDVDEKETMTAEEYMYERINFTYRHENEERS